MDAVTPTDLLRLHDKAADAARLLRLLANEKRLLILCLLVAHGEKDVSGLAEAVGLSQSALSQHLAKLREDDLVAFRRESQTLYYRLADPRAGRVLATLKDIFCPDENGADDAVAHGEPARSERNRLRPALDKR
jgi:ArsR family transcriptional regulator, virulence genes transcriptional regulator